MSPPLSCPITIDLYHTAAMLNLRRIQSFVFARQASHWICVWPRLAVRKQSFLFPRDSTWPPSDKGLSLIVWRGCDFIFTAGHICTNQSKTIDIYQILYLKLNLLAVCEKLTTPPQFTFQPIRLPRCCIICQELSHGPFYYDLGHDEKLLKFKFPIEE